MTVPSVLRTLPSLSISPSHLANTESEFEPPALPLWLFEDPRCTGEDPDRWQHNVPNHHHQFQPASYFTPDFGLFPPDLPDLYGALNITYWGQIFQTATTRLHHPP